MTSRFSGSISPLAIPGIDEADEELVAPFGVAESECLGDLRMATHVGADDAEERGERRVAPRSARGRRRGSASNLREETLLPDSAASLNRP